METIKSLEQELSKVIIENVLPDIDKYNSVSYHVSLVESAFVRPFDVLMAFMKFDDGNRVKWQFYRTYYSFAYGYDEKLYREILEKKLRIYESIYK